MDSAEADTIVSTVAAWAIARDDIRAMALVGWWARGNPRQGSDIDLLLLSDQADEYQRLRQWVAEIDFTASHARGMTRLPTEATYSLSSTLPG